MVILETLGFTTPVASIRHKRALKIIPRRHLTHHLTGDLTLPPSTLSGFRATLNLLKPLSPAMNDVKFSCMMKFVLHRFIVMNTQSMDFGCRKNQSQKGLLLRNQPRRSFSQGTTFPIPIFGFGDGVFI